MKKIQILFFIILCFLLFTFSKTKDENDDIPSKEVVTEYTSDQESKDFDSKTKNTKGKLSLEDLEKELLGNKPARVLQTYSPQKIASLIFPSVVLLIMQDRYGQPLSLGSGFFIQKGIVASNYHVIQGAAAGYAKIIGKAGNYKVRGILGKSERYDLVLLSVPDVDAPSLPQSTEEVKIGDAVYAVGNPRGLEGTFSEGIVSSVRKIGNEEIIQITAPISPGSSGGPIVNAKGQVIGVAAATIQGGQNLNFAIPARYLKNLIEGKQELQPFVPIRKQVKSIINEFGKESISGVSCENFLWNKAFDNDSIKDHEFSFSLRNHLNTPIKNINILIIFYDSQGKPLDYIEINTRYESNVSDFIIPPNLAKRIDSTVPYSVKKLITKKINFMDFADKPFTKVEFRVLGYDIVR